jgi:heat-inducible transcriptional repressor
VLRAIVQDYVSTNDPVGSKALAARYDLGVSPATIRNDMAVLEEEGYITQPHTSAGRVPTDKGYRAYVDSLMGRPPILAAERERLAEQISTGGSAIEAILRRAAQSLGVITQELGVALGPGLDAAVLRRLELVRLSAERVLLVLTLDGGAVRTIFVETGGAIADRALAEVALVLNERLAGLSMREIRATLGARLRDSSPTADASDLLNVFVEEGEQLFDASLGIEEGDVVLGQPSLLAEQPEFASGESMRKLIALTERRHHLAQLLRKRSSTPGISITIGNEHGDPGLESFTVVTAEYHAGALSGVIGVIGPTRMPYEKVISLVSHTSRLVTDLFD